MTTDFIWENMIREGEVAGVSATFLARTGSTNDDAMAMVRRGDQPPLLVVADRQSSGRGRLGRPWFSPAASGLYFTLVVSADLAPEIMAAVSLAVGVGCAAAIKKCCGVETKIKWPNDLILDDRKLGGILCETAPLAPGRAATVAIGVGINVNTPLEKMPEEIRKRSISLAAHLGKTVDRGPLLAGLVGAITAEVKELATLGMAPLLEKWQRLDWTLDRELAWVGIDGKKVIGSGCGLNREGFLLIRDHDGKTVPVISGDIELVK